MVNRKICCPNTPVTSEKEALMLIKELLASPGILVLRPNSYSSSKVFSVQILPKVAQNPNTPCIYLP